MRNIIVKERDDDCDGRSRDKIIKVNNNVLVGGKKKNGSHKKTK